MNLYSTSITKAVARLFMLALAVTTHVVNGEEKIIIVGEYSIFSTVCYKSIASFLFDTHPKIILHASCLLLFKPSQLRVGVKIIAYMHIMPAAVIQIGSSVEWIGYPCVTNARKKAMTVMLSAVKLRTLMLTLKEPLWTKPKGG
jgi:hypothetical protein